MKNVEVTRKTFKNYVAAVKFRNKLRKENKKAVMTNWIKDGITYKYSVYFYAEASK